MIEPLTFNLKQHTPMLHFQASQHGATLRASDVKPRFDRWLIDNIIAGNDLSEKFANCKRYLIGYPGDPEEKGLSEKVKSERERAISLLETKFKAGFRALNYKMRIVQPDDVSKKLEKWTDDGKKAPMFFGRGKSLLFCSENELTFSFHGLSAEYDKELRNIIEQNIHAFFINNNFGTRATKGYGSFGIGDSTDDPVSPFYFIHPIDSDILSSWTGLMRKIELLYKALRSGINEPDKMYFKSLLFSYAKDVAKQQWDKKSIKSQYLKKALSDNIKRINPDVDVLNYETEPVVDTSSGYKRKYRLDFRDALGLSSSEDWDYYGVKIKKYARIDNQPVMRFTSPLLFKPILEFKKDISGKLLPSCWKIYILNNEIPRDFLGTAVLINADDVLNSKKKPAEDKFQSMREKQDKRIVDEFKEKRVYLRIPDKDFLSEYLEYVFGNGPDLSHPDFESHFANVYHKVSDNGDVIQVKYQENYPDRVLLKSVLEEIRNNKK